MLFWILMQKHFLVLSMCIIRRLAFKGKCLMLQMMLPNMRVTFTVQSVLGQGVSSVLEIKRLARLVRWDNRVAYTLQFGVLTRHMSRPWSNLLIDNILHSHATCLRVTITHDVVRGGRQCCLQTLEVSVVHNQVMILSLSLLNYVPPVLSSVLRMHLQQVASLGDTCLRAFYQRIGSSEYRKPHIRLNQVGILWYLYQLCMLKSIS